MRMMCALVLAVAAVTPVSAKTINQSTARQIEKLAPREQLEQRCDTEGMDKVSGDKVIAYTFADPEYGKTHIEAPGAVFRRKGEWYHLSYHCTTTPDHLTVLKFEFTIGSRIPKSDWGQYYLYD